MKFETFLKTFVKYNQLTIQDVFQLLPFLFIYQNETIFKLWKKKIPTQSCQEFQYDGVYLTHTFRAIQLVKEKTDSAGPTPILNSIKFEILFYLSN